VGAVLLAAGLCGLLLAINALPRLRDGDLLAAFLFPAAVLSLAAFAWWETRTSHPIVRVELFRNVGFAVINLASCLMYLVTFSVMLIGPFFIKPLIISRYGDYWGGFASGIVLGAGFIAASLASPLAAPLVTRLGAVRVVSLGGLLIGLGLILVGTWQPQTPTLAMVAVLALQGVGTAFFQVAYMELVLATAPLAHRGVAGSLSMLTRTIGTVTGAASLMLGFQTIAAAARATGAEPQQAFLTAFHTMFLLAGCVAIATGALVVLAVRRPAQPAPET
jgi:MFS family permease